MTTRSFRFFAFCLGLTGIGFFWTALNAAVPIPELSGPVIDQAGLFSNSENSELERLIRSQHPQLQLQVWTLPSLEGDAIENVSIRAVEKWKLGSEKNDNGALLMIVTQDRRMRIEVGQGLEGAIPDAISARIIREILGPRFKEGRFFEGTQEALRQMIALSAGEDFQEPTSSSAPLSLFEKIFSALLPFFIFFLIFFLQVMKAKSRSAMIGNRHWSRGSRSTPWIGGGGFGGGFGGGGWSGGGGGFSGGGASGGW